MKQSDYDFIILLLLILLFNICFYLATTIYR